MDWEKIGIGAAIMAPVTFVITLMVCLVTDSLPAFKFGLFGTLALIAISGICITFAWIRDA